MSNELLEELIKGTDFEVSSKVEVLTERRKVSTPLPILNSILGGGIPFGAVLQAYGVPKCFPGEVRIFTTSGSKSLKELYDLGKPFYVYSFNLESQEIEVSKAESVIQEREVSELIEVMIDNEFTIKCTIDHPFLLKSGQYVKAEDLS